MHAILIALSVGGYVAQRLVEYVLVEHHQETLLATWLALDGPGIAAGEYWKFLSYSLLHFDPLQLVGNMLLLYFAGREVESILGWRHFLGIYLVGIVLGGVVSFAAQDLPVLGTSAAVTAVVIAFASILPELELRANVFFILPLRIRAKWFALALLAVSGAMWASHMPPQIGAPGMLAAGIAAWAYVKQLGFGNPLAIQRYIFNRRQRAARLDRMSPEQFITAEIDPILDKISREGMHSLTRAERKILALGREKIAARIAAR